MYPFQLRNFLLWLAEEGLYEPLWSESILEEVRRNLRDSSRMTEEQLAHLEAQMARAFPDALGRTFQKLEEGVRLIDEDDRHVVSLAVHYEADLIVTWNTRHFPAALLAGYHLEAIRPPSFLDRLWAMGPERVVRAAEMHRTSLVRDPMTPRAYLESLATYARLRRCAQRLERAGFVDSAPGRPS